MGQGHGAWPGKITGFPSTALCALPAMSFFARPHYTSDATQFIDQLKTAQPQLEAEQRQGRALLWDKTLDREFQRDAEAARVPQGAYVYQTLPDPH